MVDSSVKTQLEGEMSSPNWIVQTGTLRSDGGSCVTTDTIGNVYVAGYTEGYLPGGRKPGETTLNNDSFIFKFNNNGDILWKQQFGDPAVPDTPSSVAVDALGNVYVAGTTKSTLSGLGGFSDGYLTKFSSTGQMLWQKNLGSSVKDEAHGIAIDSFGNAYVTGSSEGYGSAQLLESDAFLIKFDGNGTQLWQQTLDFAALDIGYGITIDSANQIYVVGQAGETLQGTNTGEKDSFVAKYDVNGNQQWAKASGIEGDDQAVAVTTDRTGNLYITGSSGTALQPEIYAMKVSSAGDLDWLQSFNEGSSTKVTGITLDANQNAYITAQTKSTLFSGYMGGVDVLLLKLDSNGNQVGSHQIGTMGNDVPNGITIDPSGNLFVTGWTLGTLGTKSEGYNDLFLIKYGNNPLPYVTPPPSTNPTTPSNPTQPENPTGLNTPSIPGITLKGSSRNDTLRGTAGNDTLIGMNGNDRLIGLDGLDRLVGGSGNDRLMGDTGEDILNGSSGFNRLRGGTGNDQLILNKGNGVDTILDFRLGEDQMILPRGLRPNQIDMTRSGNRTIVSYKEDVLAILVGGGSANLTRALGQTELWFTTHEF